MAKIEDVPSAPPAPSSSWEDFIDIYVAPRQVFQRHVDGRFLAALIFLTVTMALLFYASQGPLADAYEAEFLRGLARTQERSGQQMDAEQLQQFRQVRGSMSGILGTLGFLFTFPIGVVLTGYVASLAGKLFDSRASVAGAMAVATFAQFPKILQSIASILQGLLLNPQALNEVSVGPARFIDAASTSPLVLGMLSRLDLFVIWGVLLMGIGLSVVGAMPRARGYATAVVVWVVASLPTVLAGLFS